MRQILLLAGAAALLGAAPATAKPGQGGGPKAHSGHSVHKSHATRIGARRLGLEVCPPGLAKKPVRCMPPGQAGRILALGARVPTGWGTIPFTRIPLSVRDQYDLLRSDRYVYRNGTLYVVDPRTRLIERIITALTF